MGETEEAHHSSIDPPEGVDSPGCDGLIAGPLADIPACTLTESPEHPKHTMIYLNHICSGSQMVPLKDTVYFCNVICGVFSFTLAVALTYLANLYQTQLGWSVACF